MEKILVSWSGGKDSALTLYEIQQTKQYDIRALLTVLAEEYDRISMHGVRRSLLEKQAVSLGYPLEKIVISRTTSIEEYGVTMGKSLSKYRGEGVSAVAIGDIFLEEVRSYREDNLARVGLKGIFPLWNKDTLGLSRNFIKLGFKAIVTCVDSKVLGKQFVGRLFDEHFLSTLPSTVDPGGENGEFHTFVFDGPLFKEKIAFSRGDIVLRENRFYYCDLKNPSQLH